MRLIELGIDAAIATEFATDARGVRSRRERLNEVGETDAGTAEEEGNADGLTCAFVPLSFSSEVAALDGG